MTATQNPYGQRDEGWSSASAPIDTTSMTMAKTVIDIRIIVRTSQAA